MLVLSRLFYTCSCKFGIAFSVYLFGKVCDGSALQHMIGHSHGEVCGCLFVLTAAARIGKYL